MTLSIITCRVIIMRSVLQRIQIYWRILIQIQDLLSITKQNNESSLYQQLITTQRNTQTLNIGLVNQHLGSAGSRPLYIKIISIVEMGKGRFDKKQAVRFNLVPGPVKDGKPSVLFKPVEVQRTKLSKKQRKSIITELSDYDEITINGKIVDQNEIPSFVLDQIRGRKDLVFNQMHQQQEQVGDLYEVQDVREADDDEDYEEYEDIEDDYQEKLCKVQEGPYEDQNDDENWEDDDEEQYEDEEVQIVEEEIVQKEEEVKKYVHKAEDFPVLEELQDVEIDGITYKLTKAQAKLIDTVIPENYEQLDFGGLNFKKYNEDGLLISEKEKYEKYYFKEEDNVVIVDSYNYVPSKPVDIVDNDYKPSQINGNPQLKEIEEALNYNGQEEAYQEMEDDFFAKMIEMELQDKKVKTKAGQKKKEAEKVQVIEIKKPKETKQEVKKIQAQQPIKDKVVDKDLDEQLEKALFNFQHNIEQQKNETLEDDEDDDDQSGERNFSMNFTDLEKREEYIGRDGELDWRNLTKKQKRQYMKTKVIRQYYDELRQREIEDKMKGIKNVTPDQLHLKTLVKHLTYEQDHVLRKALEDDLKQQVDMDAQEEDYSSYSSEDDIVSFHQKTSIIASNLSVIQEPKKKKPRKENNENQEETPSEISKIKVVPEQRNRNQTKEERKERKNKLRAQKKEKKEQKKQFAEQFNKIKKDFKKKQNTTNPLNKVSYVKIH